MARVVEVSRTGSSLAMALLIAMGATSQPALAQAPAAIGHATGLLRRQLAATALPALRVSSPTFRQRGELPLVATQYGANQFPGLTWSAGPAGTRSYLVVIQGELAGGSTSIHLVMANVPASVTSLPAGSSVLPTGALYGPNVHGLAQPYSGPHTHGQQRQPYHFQVLALDRILPAESVGSIESLLSGAQGHVLASGDLVGYAAAPPAQIRRREAAPVKIDAGLVSGVPGLDPAITVYKGIPYAAPPVGPLRWRPPAPVSPWSGVKAAVHFGALCPQPVDQQTSAAAMDEDCLTLNVWVPPTGSAEKRPVLVWMYGGGFIQGTGASPEFDGEGLARKGVIVVTFNYRLGVLGFLATPQLSAESGHNASGNYGLLDDIAVLKWVRRNIAAFGGDPARVTIAGQSAGAGSVGFLSGSPLAKGLFQRSIAESHARYPRDPDLRFLSVSYRRLAAAEAAGMRYGNEHGAGSLAALRALPWQDLIRGSNTVDADVQTRSSGKPPLFRPVVDGWVIPRTYTDMLAGRTQNDVTFVAGNNRDETGSVPPTAFGSLRARNTPPRAGMPQVSVTIAEYVRAARAKYGNLSDEFLRLYPAANDDQAALASNQAAQDNNRISTYLWAVEWSKGVTKPIYTYWWTHAPPGRDATVRGAYHGSEINYVFNNLYATNRPWTDEDRRIADLMSSYWANIIKSGDPNGPGLPSWPAFNSSAKTVMRLGDQWRPMPVTDDPRKLAFWRRFYASQDAW